jgi:hypothetical protein
MAGKRILYTGNFCVGNASLISKSTSVERMGGGGRQPGGADFSNRCFAVKFSFFFHYC